MRRDVPFFEGVEGYSKMEQNISAGFPDAKPGNSYKNDRHIFGGMEARPNEVDHDTQTTDTVGSFNRCNNNSLYELVLCSFTPFFSSVAEKLCTPSKTLNGCFLVLSSIAKAQSEFFISSCPKVYRTPDSQIRQQTHRPFASIGVGSDTFCVLRQKR